MFRHWKSTTFLFSIRHQSKLTRTIFKLSRNVQMYSLHPHNQLPPLGTHFKGRIFSNTTIRTNFGTEDTYYFPDIVPSQVTLSVLHICDDFVGLLTHDSHVQVRLVAVTFTGMLVQSAPGTV